MLKNTSTPFVYSRSINFTIQKILDTSLEFIELNRQSEKKLKLLNGKITNKSFFESSTRTLSSFELALKKLGADVMNMNVSNSAIKKGETLIDTAMTLNAMHPDILVIRHQDCWAAKLYYLKKLIAL